MGLIWHVPGFPNYAYDTRHGDSQFFLDKRPNGDLHFFVIDGYDSDGDDRMIEDLKLFKAHSDKAEIWAQISHAHWDHYKGIRTLMAHKTNGKYTFNVTRLYMYDPASLKVGLKDNKASNYIRNEIQTMRTIEAEAKSRGIKVIYVKNKSKISWGEISCQLFREQPTKIDDDDHKGDGYINDGSIVTWFPKLRYLTSGDGPRYIGKFCEKYKLDPIFIKGPHHGNNMPRKQATIMKDRGCLYYWDNDLSKSITDFLQTGREDAIGVGMKVLNVVGDINGVAQNGHFYIYKGGKIAFNIECDFDGKKAVIQKPTVNLVRQIIRGKYSSGDRRTTKILAVGYAPSSAQKKVTKVIKLAKDIYSGKADYGQNKARWDKIDKELGAGFGKLVQDYINVLAGVKESV